MTSKYDNFISKISSPPEWRQSDETTLLEPHTYLSSTPGKDIRGRMMEAFNVWLAVPPDDLAIIAKVVGMLHNASLIIDDVQDDSQLRRGIPVAHKIYGIPQAINSANYVYFLAYQELFKLRDQRKPGPSGAEVELDRIVTEELLNLHRGQGLDLFWRDTLTCPTEEQYIEMVNNKTGGLFRLAIKLMMAKSPSNRTDFVPLVNLIGVLFQIRDDYMNLQSNEYADNKGFCEDLTEGKFSFPVVHSVRSDTSNRQIINVLAKRPSTPTMKRYAVNYMQERTGSFAYTREVLVKLDKQAREEIARLGGNPKLEAILDALSVLDSEQS